MVVTRGRDEDLRVARLPRMRRSAVMVRLPAMPPARGPRPRWAAPPLHPRGRRPPADAPRDPRTGPPRPDPVRHERDHAPARADHPGAVGQRRPVPLPVHPAGVAGAREGENVLDHWLPQVETGVPQFLYYQHLPALVVVGMQRLSFGTMDLLTTFNLVRYILLIGFPFTVFLAMRCSGSRPSRRRWRRRPRRCCRAIPLRLRIRQLHLPRPRGLHPAIRDAPGVPDGRGGLPGVPARQGAVDRGRPVRPARADPRLLRLHDGDGDRGPVVWGHEPRPTCVTRLWRDRGRRRFAAVISSYMWLPFLTLSPRLNATPYLQPEKYDSYGAGTILSLAGDGRLLRPRPAAGADAAVRARGRGGARRPEPGGARRAGAVRRLAGRLLRSPDARAAGGPAAAARRPAAPSVQRRRGPRGDHPDGPRRGRDLGAAAAASVGPARVAARSSARPAPGAGDPRAVEFYGLNTVFLQRTYDAVHGTRTPRTSWPSSSRCRPDRTYAGLFTTYGKADEVRRRLLLRPVDVPRARRVRAAEREHLVQRRLHLGLQRAGSGRLRPVQRALRRGPEGPADGRLPDADHGDVKYTLYQAPTSGYAKYVAIGSRQAVATKADLFDADRAWERTRRRAGIRRSSGSTTRPRPSGTGPSSVPGCPDGGQTTFSVFHPGRFNLVVACPADFHADHQDDVPPELARHRRRGGGAHVHGVAVVPRHLDARRQAPGRGDLPGDADQDPCCSSAG